MGRKRRQTSTKSPGAMDVVVSTLMETVSNAVATASNTTAQPDAPTPSVNPTSTGTVTTAAPTAKTWSVDSAVMWLVTIFYFVIAAAALLYFVARWRRRMYGAERAHLRGSAAADGAGNAPAAAEGLVATVSSIIDRVMGGTALAGPAAFQRADGGRHRPVRSRSGGAGGGGGGGRGRSWLSGITSLLGSPPPQPAPRGLAGRRGRSQPASAHPPQQQRPHDDDRHEDAEEAPASVWNDAEGMPGGSAVPATGIPTTLTARDTRGGQQ